MVEELKNKWEVSDDALGWVMEWKWGAHLASPLGGFGAQGISQITFSTTAGSWTTDDGARGVEPGDETREERHPVWE